MMPKLSREYQRSQRVTLTKANSKCRLVNFVYPSVVFLAFLMIFLCMSQNLLPLVFFFSFSLFMLKSEVLGLHRII